MIPWIGRRWTISVFFAALVLVSPRVSIGGNERLIAAESALLKHMKECEGECGSEYDERMDALTYELSKLLRLTVNGRLCPIGSVSLCRELGECPDNDRKDTYGGPLCCALIFPDETCHRAEFIKKNCFLNIAKGYHLKVRYHKALGMVRFYLVTKCAFPPVVTELSVSSKGRLLLPPPLIREALIRICGVSTLPGVAERIDFRIRSTPDCARFILLFGILKGKGEHFFKKVLWILGPVLDP